MDCPHNSAEVNSGKRIPAAEDNNVFYLEAQCGITRSSFHRERWREKNRGERRRDKEGGTEDEMR